MGQYYILINLDARQCMSVFAGGFSFGNDSFSSGCKLAEQWWNLGRKPFLALSLLAAGNKISGPIGSWAGQTVHFVVMSMLLCLSLCNVCPCPYMFAKLSLTYVIWNNAWCNITAFQVRCLYSSSIVVVLHDSANGSFERLLRCIGDRVVLIGDYSDDYPDFLEEEEIDELKSSKCNLYSLAGMLNLPSFSLLRDM